MVTEDFISLYPGIPHNAGLEALGKILDNQENKKISTDNLTKMSEFVLKSNLNLMERSRNKFWRRSLLPNLHLQTHVYLQTEQRLNFLKSKTKAFNLASLH